MKLKRMSAVLLIIIFALSGCMSTLPMNNTTAIYQIYSETEQMNAPAPVLTSEVMAIETITQEPETIYSEEVGTGGVSWILGKVQEGSVGKRIEHYNATKDADGTIVAKTLLLDQTQELEATPEIIQYGADVAEGNLFFPKMTTYGVDCIGCRGETTGEGNTGMGIKLSVANGVLQADGTWSSGIKYGNYYMVAADNVLPLCSVLEISNHNYSGEGLTPGEPFQAIVVDRGGGVKGSHLDLYVGSQKSGKVSKSGSRSPKVEIKRVGGRNGSTCAP